MKTFQMWSGRVLMVIGFILIAVGIWLAAKYYSIIGIPAIIIGIMIVVFSMSVLRHHRDEKIRNEAVGEAKRR